jgi:hypothetical protein
MNYAHRDVFSVRQEASSLKIEYALQIALIAFCKAMQQSTKVVWIKI